MSSQIHQNTGPFILIFFRQKNTQGELAAFEKSSQILMEEEEQTEGRTRGGKEKNKEKSAEAHILNAASS